MKYLIDAQLPKRLSLELEGMGFNCIHTLDLLKKNKTKDRDINSISVSEKRIIISKDSDFVDSILISKKPYKLLHVTTGNISNNELLKIFQDNFCNIDNLFETHRYIELNPITIITHQ